MPSLLPLLPLWLILIVEIELLGVVVGPSTPSDLVDHKHSIRGVLLVLHGFLRADYSHLDIGDEGRPSVDMLLCLFRHDFYRGMVCVISILRWLLLPTRWYNRL